MFLSAAIVEQARDANPGKRKAPHSARQAFGSRRAWEQCFLLYPSRFGVAILIPAEFVLKWNLAQDAGWPTAAKHEHSK
jgi:hypothetical protein